MPKYVADSPDSMPSIRIYDGDLLTLMAAFDKLKERMNSAEATLSAILQTVNTTKDVLITPPVNNPLCDPVPSRVQCVVNSASQSRMAGQTQADAPAGNNETTVTGFPNQVSADLLSTWAATVAASSPAHLSNRFSALQHLDDGYDAASDIQSDDDFAEPSSRRALKRRRQKSKQNQQNLQRHDQRQEPEQAQRQRSRSDAVEATQQHDTQRGGLRNAAERRGRLTMTGKSNVSSGQKLTAARSIVKKAVFCVDNVSTSVTVDDLKQFVTGLSVNVVSCFSVKPRRLRNEPEPVKDRSAFRLCIAEKDRDLLLDESKWPESVIISEWFHVNPARREQRPRTEERTAAAVTDRPSGASDASGGNEADDTMVYCTGTSTAGAECMDLLTTGDNGEQQ